MAAIDFPASPVDNQLFAAANGVTYQWNATPGLWRAVTTSTGTQANFYARAVTSIPGTVTTPTNFAVMTGNEGGWFTPANGRFTPPAGRYRLSAGFGSGRMTSQATNLATYLRKNGVILTNPTVTTALANYWSEAYAEYIVDANGTDWFDAQYVSAQGSTDNAAEIWFCAIPVGAIVPIPRQVDLTHLPGSFTAYVAGGAVSGSLLPVVFGTVVTGNEGGFYNVSNGRFTPPAGRYLLTYSLCCSVTAAGHINGYFYKNGSQIGALTSQYISAAGGNGTISSSVEVDANGTDFFDVRLNAGVAGTLAQGGFSGAPVGVVEAMPAPGDGTLRLYSESQLVASAAQIVVPIPATWKRLQLQWQTLNVGTVSSILFLQGMLGGTPTTPGTVYTIHTYGQGSVPAGSSSAGPINSFQLLTLNNGTGTAELTLAGTSSSVYVTGSIYGAGPGLIHSSFGGHGLQRPPNIDGLRLVNATAGPLFDVGSYLRCYVVT